MWGGFGGTDEGSLQRREPGGLRHCRTRTGLAEARIDAPWSRVWRLSRSDADPWAGVVDVALGIPQRRFILRLRRGRGIPRADHDLMLSGVEIDGRSPLPPGPRPEIVEQFRLHRVAGIKRDVHARDVALTTGKRVAPDLGLPGSNRVARRR